MKKNRTLKGTLLAVAVVAMSFCFSSCSDEVALESVNTRVMEETIYWNQWTDYVDNQNNIRYKYHVTEWDAISTDVLNYGTVTAYFYDGDNQTPLPYVIPITYNTATGPVVVGENLRYDLQPGSITFIMQDLDAELPTGLDNTAPLTFRVVATVPVQYLLGR